MGKNQFFDIENPPTVQRRFWNAPVTRAQEGEDFNFGGVAATVGQEYTLWSGDGFEYREELAPGFFDEVLSDDVRVLFNHDSNMILGRTKPGTAKVWTDEKGYLRYAWKNDEDISYAKNLARSIERGDVTESSFGFSVDWDNIEYQEFTEGDVRVRKQILKKAKKLYDVSPVTYPANPETVVDKRSMEAIEQEFAKRFEQHPPEQEPEFDGDEVAEVYLKIATLNQRIAEF